jgi:damage-control phosphatase, subfamily I
MHTDPACVPCFLRGAMATAQLLHLSTADQQRFATEAGSLAARHDPACSPAMLGQQVQRCLRAIAGPDPYATIKETSNTLAWRLLPEVAARIAAAPDRFEAALRYSIAGNCIDFGKGHDIGEPEVLATLERLAAVRLDMELVERLRRLCDAARRIVFLADNAGEVVFDRLLLERLPIGRVTVIVRGSPVINDATMADACRARLADFARIIDSGSDAPGTVVTDLARPAWDALTQADLVIAKGQGNYESLEPSSRDHVHLLLVKCAVVATQTGLVQGAPAIIHHPGHLSRRLADPEMIR